MQKKYRIITQNGKTVANGISSLELAKETLLLYQLDYPQDTYSIESYTDYSSSD